MGIFVIEVKSWKSLEYIHKNDPFQQVHNYKNILLGHIEDSLGKIPINVEYRVIFTQISKKEADPFFKAHPNYRHFQNLTLFKEDLKDKNTFQKFFYASKTLIPNKKEFLKIASIIVDKKSLKERESKILPIITKDEVLFFDLKQLSILNGYTGGFRIIRGVAGTGKTVILTNYVANRAKRYPEEKFLVLCYNTKLKKSIQEAFGEELKRQVATLSLFELIKKIEFDYESVGIKENEPLNSKFEKLKTKEATEEFRQKFRQRLNKKPIDLFLCDETQDMPPNILRVIYEEIKDAIFFIDEGQKFYPYSMDSIAEVFHHPDFPKLSMRGRVKNLKNVYRTPSNIAKCAFEILSHDSSLNTYYKSSHYLQNSFLQDINFVLEDGKIICDDFEDIEALKDIMARTPNKDITILRQYRSDIQRLQNHFPKNVQILTFQGIKGLESEVIILHNFDRFLLTALKYEKELLYRKVYVLLTRAKERLYISLPNNFGDTSQEITTILQTIQKYTSASNSSGEISSASLIPKVKKENLEMAVLATEFFAAIAGFFA